MESKLTLEDKKRLLEISRETITRALESGKGSDDRFIADGVPQESRGAFVTLHLKNRLRGCIGTFKGEGPLSKTVSEMSVQAALHDPRFPPLSRDELDDVEIEISALTPMREVKSHEEVIVGEHGVYITKGFKHGVLLPQVAAEQGWDRETFLDHTCLKAGLKHGDWKKPGVKISVFSAEVFNEHEIFDDEAS